jgi:hypothetical protein
MSKELPGLLLIAITPILIVSCVNNDKPLPSPSPITEITSSPSPLEETPSPLPSSDVSSSDTSSIESNISGISGCWQSNYGSDVVSITDTYNLDQEGNYSGSRKTVGVNTGYTMTNYSGKWAVNDGYVLIRDDTRDATITLKVISKYELRSGTDTVYSRC